MKSCKDMVNMGITFVLFSVCTVCTAQFTVFEMDSVSNKLLWNEHDSKIYASISSVNGSNGNSIGRINPQTLELESTVFVGSEPTEIAFSDNGEFLYIGFLGTPLVKQLDMNFQTITYEVQLGTHHTGGEPLFAEDIEVRPGYPNTIAVARRRYGVAPRHGGVVIITNGILLPQAAVNTGSNKIEFNDSEVIIGYMNDSNEFLLHTMAVSDQGVTAQNAYSSVLGGFGVDILKGDDRLYSTNGRAINLDPVPYQVGVFSGVNGPVYFNSLTNQVCFVTSSTFGINATFRIFDVLSFQLLEEFTVYGTGGNVLSLTGCGNGCYAFNTAERIYILKSIETGVSDITSDSEIVVYPNPTSGLLSIQTNNGVQSAELVDLSGKTILRESGKDHIDFTSLPGGLYILKVLDISGNFSTHRVVKE